MSAAPLWCSRSCSWSSSAQSAAASSRRSRPESAAALSLAKARNREYAADAAIESSIARCASSGAASTNCVGPDTYSTFENPVVPIHVDCTNTADGRRPLVGLARPAERRAVQRMSDLGRCYRDVSRLEDDHRRRGQFSKRRQRTGRDHICAVLECERMNARRPSRKNPWNGSEAGMTLVEVIISVVILTMITGALSTAFVSALRPSKVSRRACQRVERRADHRRVLHTRRGSDSAGRIRRPDR